MACDPSGELEKGAVKKGVESARFCERQTEATDLSSQAGVNHLGSEADDEATDEEGVSDDSVLSNPVLTQTISSAHRRNFHAFIIFNALSCILPSPFPIHKNTNALSEVTAFKSSLATSRQFIFVQSGLMTTTSNVPKFSLVNSHVFTLSIFTLSGTCALSAGSLRHRLHP